MYELWSYHDNRMNPMYELWSYHDNGFIIDELCYIISFMTFIMTPTHLSLPILTKSLPLLQSEFLAVKLNAEQENFSLHLLCLPRWEIESSQKWEMQFGKRENFGHVFLSTYVSLFENVFTLNLTTHLTFLPYVSVSWVENPTDSPKPKVIVSFELPEGQVKSEIKTSWCRMIWVSWL